jgi:putative RNA 2'-phosphotransferase
MRIKESQQLARFIQYVLGRRPDEFGLVPDADGFIPAADLLKVAKEEGWHHVRRHDLAFLSQQLNQPVLEIRNHLVRAVNRSRLERYRETTDGPKLLYASIRRRAYETVLQHGLKPQGHIGQVILCAAENLAQKIGRRRDSAPIIVTVHVHSARQCGVVFRQFGDGLYLADHLPASCCRLPRPPQTNKRDEQKHVDAPATAKTPGSFTLDIEPLVDSPNPWKPSPRERRSKDWKKARQKERRWKQDHRHPP